MPLLNHSLCCHVACRGNCQTAVPYLKNIFEMRSGMNFALGTGGDMAGLRPKLTFSRDSELGSNSPVTCRLVKNDLDRNHSFVLVVVPLWIQK